MRLVVLAVVLAGCSGASDPPAVDGATDSPAIDASIDGGVSVITPSCVDEDGSRIKVIKLRHADDALVGEVALYDTLEARECSFELAADGSTRCFPGEGPHRLVYQDAGCTAPLLESYFTPTPGQAFSVRASTNVCVNGLRVVIAGQPAPLQTAVFMHDETGACVSVPPADGYVYNQIAGERPASMFVEGTVEQIGGGRITGRAVDGSDGSRWCVREGGGAYSLRDAVLDNRACEVGHAFDLEQRCLPKPALVRVGPYHYDSSSCTTPKDLLVPQGPGCLSALLPLDHQISSRMEYTPCGRLAPVFRSAGVATTGFVLWNGVCSPVPEAYEVGPEIPPTALAAVTHTWSGGTRLDGEIQVIGDVMLPTGTWRDKQFGFGCTFRQRDLTTWQCEPYSPLAPRALLYTDASCASTAIEGGFMRPPDYPCLQPTGPVVISKYNTTTNQPSFHQPGPVISNVTHYRMWERDTCTAIPTGSTSYTLGPDIQLATATRQ